MSNLDECWNHARTQQAVSIVLVRRTSVYTRIRVEESAGRIPQQTAAGAIDSQAVQYLLCGNRSRLTMIPSCCYDCSAGLSCSPELVGCSAARIQLALAPFYRLCSETCHDYHRYHVCTFINEGTPTAVLYKRHRLCSCPLSRYRASQICASVYVLMFSEMVRVQITTSLLDMTHSSIFFVSKNRLGARHNKAVGVVSTVIIV